MPGLPAPDLPSEERAEFRHVGGLYDLELIQAAYRHHSFPRHYHEGYLLGVVQRGVGVVFCRGSQHRFGPGALGVIPPGEVHDGAAEGTEPWVYSGIYAPTELMRELAHGESAPLFSELLVEDPQLAARFSRSHRRAMTTRDPLERDDCVWSMLREFVSRHGAAATGARRRSEPMGVQRCREFLEQNFAEKISLADLALVAGLSPSYLLRTFRDTVGMPPHAYLVQLRILRARRLLRRGQPAGTVAQATGFADQAHLTRHFRRAMGVTPARFQREVLGSAPSPSPSP